MQSAQGIRLEPRGEADHRPRQAARRARAPGLDPRGRRRHRRPAAHRLRPAPAEGRPGGRHPVRDGGRRGARPPQDGLPRPPQPRRDREGGGPPGRRHRQDPARRQEDVRDARAWRIDRRLPVRGLGHARGAPAGEAERVRGPDRARRALPAGPDELHPRVRTPQGRRRAGAVPRPPVGPITGPTYGICIYQEQYMEIAKQASPASHRPKRTICARRSARRSTR